MLFVKGYLKRTEGDFTLFFLYRLILPYSLAWLAQFTKESFGLEPLKDHIFYQLSSNKP
jgi:hypothetical protein|tara:strand:- start:729 stop:905 length:177 start_codon:yes stop_codon:yes gene_type:complete